MNIQIYGRSKCFDTKKAQMFFKERRIAFQFVEIDRFSMGKRELETCARACGLYELINEKSPLYTSLNLDRMRVPDLICKTLIENPKALKTPIVRNGKFATVGFKPDVWKTWE
ncbi:MAG: ArsC/Spx/MgsR family protein [Bacillota bacterium]